jgi:predicted dehydrogenase
MSTRVAIIGCGGMGKVHSDCYAALKQAGEDIVVAAAVDINPAQLPRVTDVHPEARTYTSIEAFLAQERVDIVHLTTPSYLHASMGMACLQEGINVFSEKPIALNLADAQCLAETAAECGQFLMVGQVLRFWPQYRYLKQAIEDAPWGKLQSMRLYRRGQAPGWDVRGWFLDHALSGRAPVDLHLHDVDFLNYLFGKPRAVESRLVDDGKSLSYIHTRYDYPQADLRAEAGWVKAPIGFTFGYEAIFDEAMLVMKDDVVTLYPVGGEGQSVDTGASLTMESGINLSNMGPYLAEIAYFLHCVQNCQAPTVITPASAMDSLDITLCEVESARLGKPMNL